MFSLIITIISIALVAALAIATIYYGATVWTNQQASAKASTTTNQASQIYAAALLFTQANAGCWADNPSQLTGKDPSPVSCTGQPNTVSYLNTVPVPPVAQGSSVVSSAFAADVPNWTFIKNSTGRLQYLHIAQGLPQSVCKAVQRQVKGIGVWEALRDGGDDPTANIDPTLQYQCADDHGPNTPVTAFSYYWKVPGAQADCEFLSQLNERNALSGLNSSLTCSSSPAPVPESDTNLSQSGYWLITASVTSSEADTYLMSDGYSATCPAGRIDPTGQNAVSLPKSNPVEVFNADGTLDANWTGAETNWGFPVTFPTVRGWCIPAYQYEVAVPAGTGLASSRWTLVDNMSVSTALTNVEFGSDAFYTAATITAKGQAWTMVATYFNAYPMDPLNTVFDDPGVIGIKIAIAKTANAAETYFGISTGMGAPSTGVWYSNMKGRIPFEATVIAHPPTPIAGYWLVTAMVDWDFSSLRNDGFAASCPAGAIDPTGSSARPVLPQHSNEKLKADGKLETKWTADEYDRWFNGSDSATRQWCIPAMSSDVSANLTPVGANLADTNNPDGYLPPGGDPRACGECGAYIPGVDQIVLNPDMAGLNMDPRNTYAQMARMMITAKGIKWTMFAGLFTVPTWNNDTSSWAYFEGRKIAIGKAAGVEETYYVNAPAGVVDGVTYSSESGRIHFPYTFPGATGTLTITPSSFHTLGGEPFVITGDGLEVGATVVAMDVYDWGTLTYPRDAQGRVSIAGIAPPGGNSVPWMVMNPSKTTGEVQTTRYMKPVSITSITPNSGYVDEYGPDFIVDIYGNGFQPHHIRMGGITLYAATKHPGDTCRESYLNTTQVTFISETHIQVVMPKNPGVLRGQEASMCKHTQIHNSDGAYSNVVDFTYTGPAGSCPAGYQPSNGNCMPIFGYGGGTGTSVTFFGSWTNDISYTELVLTNDVNVPASCMSSGNVSAQNLCMRDYFRARLGASASCQVSYSGAAQEVVARHPSALKEEFLTCNNVNPDNIPGVAASFPEGYKLN